VLALDQLGVTPPRVSRPSDSGVTSSRRTSLTRPEHARLDGGRPRRTTSSGLMPRCGSFPLVSFLTSSWMAASGRATDEDHLVQLAGFSPASLRAAWKGSTQRSVRSAVSCSNLARLILISRCLGPFWSAVMNGRLTSVSMRLEELDLGLLGSLGQTLQSLAVFLPEGRSPVFLEFVGDVIHEPAVIVVTAEMGIALVALTSKTPSPISSTDTS